MFPNIKNVTSNEKKSAITVCVCEIFFYLIIHIVMGENANWRTFRKYRWAKIKVTHYPNTKGLITVNMLIDLPPPIL